MTQRVLTIFRGAGLNHRAVTALAYLRDLLPVADEPNQVLKRVRAYVKQLRYQPELAFDPDKPRNLAKSVTVK